MVRGAQQGPDEQHFKIHDLDVHSVTVVGKVIDIKPDITNSNLIIDDLTAVCLISLWKMPMPQDCFVGSYVRVFGSLRQWGNENSVVAYHLRIISDFNEVTFHNLHVSYCFKPPSNNKQQQQQGYGKSKKSAGNEFGEKDIDVPSLAFFSGTPVQKNVLELITKSKDSNGAHLPDILKTFQGTYSAEEIRSSIKDLYNEGLIQSYKENWFKASSL